MNLAVLYRGIAGLIANVLLNAVLIPKAGAVGAAVATVISQIIASYAFNLIYGKLDIFKIQTLSLLGVGVFRFFNAFRIKN